MRVTLAGYNLDAEVGELLKQIIDERDSGPESTRLRDLLEHLAEEPLTPETISAAYARISRSDKGIRDLRKDSRASISRARQSNERIVFGFGHVSVAEHSVFNLDVTDASRLALEELESHRLVSFTESSQRYISMTGDFVVPDEIEEAKLGDRFREHCRQLFVTYGQLIEVLTKHHSDLPERDRPSRAREDARYVLPLACRGQVGMTLNARNAERMIHDFQHSCFTEVRKMGGQIHQILQRLVPSLIKYTDKNPLLEKTDSDLCTLSRELLQQVDKSEPDVELVDYPVQGERLASAAILFRTGLSSFQAALGKVDKMNLEEKRQLIATAHKHMTKHDPVRRELELGYFTFALALSASAFAQLKRHRMATIVRQCYQPALGVTIPPAIVEAGAEQSFNSAINSANEMFDFLSKRLPERNCASAQYALTNAHKRRIVFQANARELIHFSRLREDAHAQWDIRALAGEMMQQARIACPGLLFLTAGKDTFEDAHRSALRHLDRNDLEA
jgi:flavin-dependent thymidylate synthase